MFVRPAVLVVGVGAVRADHVDVSWNDEAEDLLPRPQRPRLEDGGLGHLPVPSGEEHEEVHHFPLPGGTTQGSTEVKTTRHLLFPRRQRLTLSKKTSLFVNLRTAVSVSCTIPMTGLFDCGVTIMRGTMASSWISALVSND